MSGIFISYRRDDSATMCGRIYDRLVAHFGREAVFKDVDSIPAGSNFKSYIERAIKQCALQIVVIGPHWLDIKDESGERRLDNPGDLVRLEIEAALQQGLRIIPLFVEQTRPLRPDQLPSSLSELAYLNALPIRNDPDFHGDIARIISSIEQTPGFSAPRPAHVNATPGVRMARPRIATSAAPARTPRPKSSVKVEPSPFASWGQRFAAFLIDGLILLFAVAIPEGIIGAITNIDLSSSTSTSSSLIVISVDGLLVLLAAVYFAYCWSRWGQTIGNRLLRNRVTRENGELLTFRDGLLRFLVGMVVVDTLPFYLGWLWPLWDGKRQALHDKLARTIVVRVQ